MTDPVQDTKDEALDDCRAPRCRGIWGFLFGHKFHFIDSTWLYENCLRCGMRSGVSSGRGERR